MKLILNDESGFTLLEALISLMISSMIILLLASSITQLNKLTEHLVVDADSLTDTSGIINEDRQLEWHLFLNQLEYNLQNSKNPNASSHVFSVDEWDKEEARYYSVSYDRPDKNRRNFLRYKNQGNIRMLNNVYLPTFKQERGWLELDFSFRNGESYQGRLWVDSWLEENPED